MPTPLIDAPKPLVSARLTTPATLFICTKCRRGSKLRRAFKRLLAAVGRKGDARVIGCGCLDLCPKRGAAVLAARTGKPARCAIVRDSTSAEAALAALLDEGVGDAVPDEKRGRIGS